MCLVCVVVRRYIDFLIILISTPLVSALFCSSIPTFFFSVHVQVHFCNLFNNISRIFSVNSCWKWGENSLPKISSYI